MQRKIHSDLNEMARGFQNLPKGTEVFEQDRGTPFRNRPAGVPQFSRQEEHEEDKKTEGSCGLQWSPLENGPSVNQSGTPLVSTTEFHNDGSIQRGPRTTFGRRLRRHSFHNSKATRSESQSSLNQAICTPSPSYSSKSGTPENFCHCRTFYPYAPVEAASRDTDAEYLHSPHTFGMPTPSRSSSRSRGETHFSFKRTIPPPLPPLDHPVFREKVDEFGVLSTKQLFFPVPEKVTRHAHSLPSIAQATKTTNSTAGISKSKSRKRSQSSTGEGDQIKRKVLHSRTSSKTSVVSSRRSSAEYSAKQASSLGHNGCWEVDVSKAIISLSVQEPSAPGMIAFPGQTCGDNVGVPLYCCRHRLFLTSIFNHYLLRIHRVSGLLGWVHLFCGRVSL